MDEPIELPVRVRLTVEMADGSTVTVTAAGKDLVGLPALSGRDVDEDVHQFGDARRSYIGGGRTHEVSFKARKLQVTTGPAGRSVDDG